MHTIVIHAANRLNYRDTKRGLLNRSPADSFTCCSLEALSLINPYNNGVTALVSFVASLLHPPPVSLPAPSPLSQAIMSILPELVTLLVVQRWNCSGCERQLCSFSIQDINESARGLPEVLSRIFPVQVRTVANKEMYKDLSGWYFWDRFCD